MADPVSATVTSSVLSAAGSGARIAGSILGGQAEKQKYAAQALKMQEAAAWGRVRAVETDTAFREELEQTMSNLKAIRAGQNADISSPTSVALEDRAREVSDRRRQTEVANIRRQVSQAESDAVALRRAGSAALTSSWIRGAPDILSMASSAFNAGQSAFGPKPGGRS